MNWLEYLWGNLFIRQKLLGLQWNMFVNWWCIPWFLLYWVTLFSASLDPMWEFQWDKLRNSMNSFKNSLESRTKPNLLGKYNSRDWHRYSHFGDLQSMSMMCLIAWAGSNWVLTSKYFLEDFLWHSLVGSLFAEMQGACGGLRTGEGLFLKETSKGRKLQEEVCHYWDT